MNLFDKVLFIADKVGRKQLAPPMEKVKELAYLGDLEQSLILYFEFLQEQLKVKKLTMSPDSYKMLQWLKKNHMH